MLHYEKRILQSNRKVIEQIEENPSLLLMMQHFNVDFRFADKTLKEIAEEIDISETLLLSIANLYSGMKPRNNPVQSKKDLNKVLFFLKNSHNYYRNEKYPEIIQIIKKLQEKHPTRELQLLEKFFEEYCTELTEHLSYEDEVAFPYFTRLIEGLDTKEFNYSATEYKDHHTDIEMKLRDFKNLLLKHINIEGDLAIRRKLLNSVLELEYDLYIHSLIEENILIPNGILIEKNNGNIS
ncbi:MAG: hypothetical protein CR965_00520 [Paludibacter sp.]|nr:MAG: hypothetical protein CR965_00520 [Paludibacter sp.]